MLPATRVMNKHMIPVLNQPMICYPLLTLHNMCILDILVISGGNHMGQLSDFLGDGMNFGVNLSYKVQKEAGGIAQALSLAKDFVKGEENFAVILGDNYFEYPVIAPEGFGLVIKEVEDPKRFGVYSHDTNRIVEKPEFPSSHQAVTGLYFYTPEIFDFIQSLAPSDRGEMEITDVNNWCLENKEVHIESYKDFWSDMGTPESMLNTINHIYGKPGPRA